MCPWQFSQADKMLVVQSDLNGPFGTHSPTAAAPSSPMDYQHPEHTSDRPSDRIPFALQRDQMGGGYSPGRLWALRSFLSWEPAQQVWLW